MRLSELTMHCPSNIIQSHGTISFDLRNIISPGNKSQVFISQNNSDLSSNL